jgi:periplasmic protein TonB
VPPLASARIIDLQAARLALARDADRAPPATLGAVPLSFRQWRGELQERAPRFGWSAWAAAAAIHAIIGTAVLLYAVFAKLPEPLPVVAVTLSFEPSKATAEPGPNRTTETPPSATPPAQTPPDQTQIAETPPVPAEPPAPEASPEIAATPEPRQAATPPEPAEVEPPPIELPPPPTPEPPVAAAPEQVAITVAPPPPPPRPTPPPRRPARPQAAPAKHKAPTQPHAPAPPPAAVPGDSDKPPAPSLSAGTPPAVEAPAAAPIIAPSPVGAAAGNPKPEYPISARRRHLEGRLVLRVDVTDSGSASSVAVAVSSGHSVLDEAALNAVRAWRFNPATRGGKAIPGVTYVPIQFRLLD